MIIVVVKSPERANRILKMPNATDKPNYVEEEPSSGRIAANAAAPASSAGTPNRGDYV